MDDRIAARIEALEAELQNLKGLVAAEVESSGPAKSDRRGMVKLLAASAVGAVTGAAMLGAKPAAAADGDNVLLGTDNLATNATTITASAQDAMILNGGSAGYGLVADGNFGNALFQGSGLDPVGGPGDLGALWVDGEGNWWAATVNSNTDAVWRKLAGPSSTGQLHILPKPVRVYDSRPNLLPNIGVKQPTVGNTPRQIDTTATAGVVPNTANAVMITLTITGPTTPGFAAVWPSGAWPGTSNINFTAGQNIATTTVSGCGPLATIQVMSNTVTDFVVDVIGYYQ